MSRTDDDWCTELGSPTPDAAIAELRSLLLRGLRFALNDHRVTDADLEDFVQESIIKVLDSLPSYRREAQFTTWAQKVAVRVALTDLRRRRWRDVSLEDMVQRQAAAEPTPAVLTDPSPDPAHATSAQLMMGTLQRLIEEELTDLQRTALTATMQGGMPLQEVADRLGTNRNALYKLLHDGRRRLKDRILREGIDPHDLLAMFG